MAKGITIQTPSENQESNQAKEEPKTTRYKASFLTPLNRDAVKQQEGGSVKAATAKQNFLTQKRLPLQSP